MVAATRPRPRTIVERPRRRFRFPRWLAVALVLSLVVLAVNSIVRTTGEGPDQRLAYLDEVRPHMEESSRQALVLADLRSEATELGRTGLRRRLDRMARDTDIVVRRVRAETVPPALDEASALLTAAVVARAAAVDRMGDALGGALGSGPPDASIDALVRVGDDLLVSDRAYALFVESLPADLRPAAPESRWITDAELWSRPELAAFVATLRASATLAPVHDVSLITIRTEPPAVGVEPHTNTVVLPPARTMQVLAVVANVGNETEKRVPVEAVVVSEGGMDVARQFVDLAPGQRMTVPLELRPAPVGVISLTVRAGLAENDPTPQDNERVLSFVMR